MFRKITSKHVPTDSGQKLSKLKENVSFFFNKFRRHDEISIYFLIAIPALCKRASTTEGTSAISYAHFWRTWTNSYRADESTAQDA